MSKWCPYLNYVTHTSADSHPKSNLVANCCTSLPKNLWHCLPVIIFFATDSTQEVFAGAFRSMFKGIEPHSAQELSYSCFAQMFTPLSSSFIAPGHIVMLIPFMSFTTVIVSTSSPQFRVYNLVLLPPVPVETPCLSGLNMFVFALFFSIKPPKLSHVTQLSHDAPIFFILLGSPCHAPACAIAGHAPASERTYSRWHMGSAHT